MRRSTVASIFVSILITICAIFPAGHAEAATVDFPSKTELEAAITRIETFADYSKYYGANTTTPITPNTPYYQEYEYLHSLVTTTNKLIANYDDESFRNHNSEAYGIALTVIDQAITSCRYLFGIVRAESLATQAAQTPSSSTTPTVTATTQSPAPTTSNTPAITAATTPTPITDNKTTTDDQPSNSTALTTFQATESQSANDNANENLPVEIPKTGGISGSSSVVFIVLVSFIAAVATTVIYFIYSRQPKHATPAPRRKPGRR